MYVPTLILHWYVCTDAWVLFSMSCRIVCWHVGILFCLYARNSTLNVFCSHFSVVSNIWIRPYVEHMTGVCGVVTYTYILLHSEDTASRREQYYFDIRSHVYSHAYTHINIQQTNTQPHPYIVTHTHIHTHIYIYTQGNRLPEWSGYKQGAFAGGSEQRVCRRRECGYFECWRCQWRSLSLHKGRRRTMYVRKCNNIESNSTVLMHGGRK